MPRTTIQTAPPEEGTVRVLDESVRDLAALTADYRPGVVNTSDSGTVTLRCQFYGEEPSQVTVSVAHLIRALAGIEQARRAALHIDPTRVAPHERIEP